jgi:hypothetical protein
VSEKIDRCGSSLFRYFNSYLGAEENAIDIVILLTTCRLLRVGLDHMNP